MTISNGKQKTKGTPLSLANASFEKARKLFLISIALLVLAILLLAQAYRVEHRATIRVNAVPQSPVKTGEQITMGAITVRLDKVIFASGEGPFTAPAGKQYAVITIDITNKSDKPIQILPANDMYMKDASGELAYISSYNLSQPFRAGELSPGEEIKGELSFLVSKDGVYKLYIDSVWSGGVIPFEVVD